MIRPRSIVVTPGQVAVTFLPPIDPASFGEDLDGLVAATRNAIAGRLSPYELHEEDREEQRGEGDDKSHGGPAKGPRGGAHLDRDRRAPQRALPRRAGATTEPDVC